MADEKFNIEVAVNAKLESLNKIQDALGELNKKLGIVSDSISSKKCLCMCHDEYWREDVRPCTKVSEFCDCGNTSFRATRGGGAKAGGGDKVAGGKRVRSSADNVFVCLGNAAHNNLRRRTSSCNAVYGDGNGSFGGSKEPVHSRRHRLD